MLGTSLIEKLHAIKAALERRLSNSEDPLLVFLDDVHINVEGRDHFCMWLLEMSNHGLLNVLFLSSEPSAFGQLSSCELFPTLKHFLKFLSFYFIFVRGRWCAWSM
jgi:hypothetical protein